MGRSRSRRRSRQRHHSREKRREKTPPNWYREKYRSSKSPLQTYQNKRSRRRSPQSSSPSSDHSSSYSSSSYSSADSPSNSVSPQTRQRRKTPHFQYRVGEKVGHKYRVTRVLGTGTFGRVVEGRYQNRLYAIKVIKPVPKYIGSAKTQRSIIKELCNRDPRDQYHLVRYVESLYHYNYFCLVFEQLGPSLFDIIKKNHYKGFPPRQVQSFIHQLLESVAFMHRNGYTHTDLKPENILLVSGETYKVADSDDENQYIHVPQNTRIKLIDFGGATHQKESHSSIINTRQYRCPEVLIQCCKWNQSSDVWSLGCIFVELVTGNLLFPVHNDVDHVYMIDKIIGKFPRWMAEDCEEKFEKLFHKDGNINTRYGDKYVKDWDEVMDLESLQRTLKGHPELTDLVRQCLQIDPKKRIRCEDALRHPYFSVNFR